MISHNQNSLTEYDDDDDSVVHFDDNHTEIHNLQVKSRLKILNITGCAGQLMNQRAREKDTEIV